ncbi:MAG: TonB family protein [Acidobacteriaceae bacterium]
MATADRSNQDNFGLLPVEKRSFRSLALSAFVNIGIAVLVLIISSAAVHVVKQNNLIANEIVFQPPTPKPVVPPPPRVKVYAPPPKTYANKIIPPPLQHLKAPPKIHPIKMPTPALPKLSAAPLRVAPPPKPKVGLFKSANPTPVANNRSHPTVHTGGFGSPLGVHPNPSQNRQTTLVAFGSPEEAPGSAHSGAGRARPGSVQGVDFGSGVANGVRGGHDRGTVASAGFSNGIVGGTGNRNSPGKVAAAAFGGNMYGSSGGHKPAQQQANTTPIIVTYKPLPTYTAQARQNHIQGDVTLRVRFTASGQVQVLDVVHGLGYGLDQQAEIAAREIRFRPATENGHPVDAIRIIRITFQIT